MKNNYVAPEAEIVVLSENDILLMSNKDVNGGNMLTLDWGQLIDLN